MCCHDYKGIEGDPLMGPLKREYEVYTSPSP